MRRRAHHTLLALLMAAMMAIGMMPFAGIADAAVNVTANVTSKGLEYSSQKALEYARANWNIDPYKVDCINYVRRCNKAGGVTTRSCTIPNYIKYLTEGGYADYYKLKTVKVKLKGSARWYVKESDNAGKIAPGDAVVWKCNKCSRSWHIAIVAPADKSGPYAGYCRYYAHNGPIDNGLISKNKHSRSYCSTPAENTDLYVVHFRSVENGFRNDGKYFSVRTKFDDLNMRSGPGTSYKAQGVASKNVELVIKATKDGWGQLACNNLWISLQFTEPVNGAQPAGSSTAGTTVAASAAPTVTPVSQTAAQPAASTKPAVQTSAKAEAGISMKTNFKVKLTKGTNLRKGPSVTKKKVGRSGKGKTYTVVAIKNGWGQIKGKGYWFNLKNAKITSGYSVRISYTDLNMRTGPGVQYKAKGYVKKGTYKVTQINGSWCKLSNGYWVMMKYTQKV